MKKITLITLISITMFACNNKASNFVEIVTNYGKFTIELFDETPLHRDNFKKLVQEGFYNDLLFHRVIDGFMIQGGDPDSKDAPSGKMLGGGNLGYTIPAELNVSERCYHKKGMLAAARKGDNINPEKASSGSQFYIVLGRTYTFQELKQIEKQRINKALQTEFNHLCVENIDSLETLKGDKKATKTFQKELYKQAKENILNTSEKYLMTKEQKNAYHGIGGTPHLDGAYTVFGQVIEGMDVIEAIAKAKTDSHDRPIKDIVMSMKFVKRE